MTLQKSADTLGQIEYFGSDAAEQEDASDYLAQHFIQTQAYRKATDGTKTIIIGRKGSGKSAIFLFLRRNKSSHDNVRMAFVVPEDVSANKIRNFSGKGINEQTAKTLVWRYLFLVLIARFLVESAKAELQDEKNWPEDLRKIRKFLVENDELDELDTMERIQKLATKIKPESITIKVSAIGEIGIGKSKEEQDSSNLAEKINDLEELLRAVANQHPAMSRRFHIYIDQVDEFWLNDEASNQMIIGLILAAYHINTRFSSVKCILFLRSDIYQVIEFHDKDKLHGTELEIHWDENSLSNLIYDRITQSLKLHKDQEKRDEIIRLVFSGEIGKTTNLAYIVGRTLRRPRDVIQFCNIALETAKKNKHSSIDSADVLEAEEIYSKWKLSDLVTEYKASYPFLNDFLTLFGKRLGQLTPDFDREYFSNKYPIIQAELSGRQSGIQSLTMDILLGILYNVNFIGIVREDTATYKYDDPRTVNSLDTQFRVHPTFWKALDVQPVARVDNEKAAEINMPIGSPPEITEQVTTPPKGIEQIAQVMAGSDEIKVEIRASKLERLILDFGALVTGLNRLMPNTGKASFVRTVAYLNQSKGLLEDVATDIRGIEEIDPYEEFGSDPGEGFDYEEFAKDRIRESLEGSRALIKACRLVEVSITHLENSSGDSEQTPRGFGSRTLAKANEDLAYWLSGFYAVLIEEYQFDMLLLSKTES
jgi:hypothetical protein